MMNFLKAWTYMQIPTQRLTVVTVVLISCLVFSPRARAQETEKIEVGIDYNYIRTNAPPGGCGCFSMNGGGGWLAYNLTNSLAAVSEFSVQHATGIGGIGANLTLTSYLFGPRYSLRWSNHIVPFGQALFGGAHANGSLAPGSPAIPGSPNVFAMTAGGGVDIMLNRHFAVRAAQVDYFLTRLKNGVNDHQNNLRFSAGVVFRFGSSR